MTPTRKLNWLWDRRIITTRYPTTDKPTKEFNWGWYYENGTHQYYSLFHSPHLISTHKSYSWHIRVLHYLNEFTYNDLHEVANFIATKSNGFTCAYISNEFIDNVINDTFNDTSDKAPENRLRKVIFKIGCGLEAHQKRSIVGQLVGRGNRLNVDDVMECAHLINESNQRITVSSLSKSLGCARNTVYGVINEDIKEEIHRLNLELNDEKLQRKKLQEIQGRHDEKSARRESMARVYTRRVDH